MATSSKKVIVTGDDINPTMDKAFAGVVGGSLESERLAWLEGCDLMARNVVSIRGMKATIENTHQNVGTLPTLTPASVQYWGKMKALHDIEGGSKKSLKELLRLAREVSAVANGKKGAPTFDKAIEGKTIEAVRKATPTAHAKRKASTASNTKVTDKKGKGESVDTLIKALNTALLEGRGGKPTYEALEELANTINTYMYDMEAVA